ncbi:G2/mitotic-specific cyclin cig2 [Taenia crassiceps]|uniref:G2/mitotic-specific cyclin cig2 n=1 Tax=Taenia crassiceps TaxID=6207 RepID=A0ABR4Q3G9_9CEST
MSRGFHPIEIDDVFAAWVGYLKSTQSGIQGGAIFLSQLPDCCATKKSTENSCASRIKYIQRIILDDTFCLSSSNPSFSYAKTDDDEQNVKDFNICGLQQSGVNFDFRKIVSGLLLRVQVAAQISDEALHLAVTYMDRFIWLHETDPPGFETMAHGALWLAVKVLTPETPITCPLMKVMTSGCLTVEEIEDWTEHLRLTLGPNLHYPTPHSYLINFLKQCDDFPACHTKLFTMVCHYLLDLGLMEYDLARRPAYLRCAAVIYFLRRLLRCTGYVFGGSPFQHQYCALEYWPVGMVKYTRCQADNNLYETALVYGNLLEETKKYQQQCAQIPLILMPILEKYMDCAYDRVAANSLMTEFELDQVMCPKEVE